MAIRLPVLAAATVRNPDRDDDAQPQEADIDDACQFGDDRCDGPEADGLPCFDCYMAAGLDHYPEDAAVAGPEIENTNWNGGGD